MLKRLLNEIRLDLTITTLGPVLIKSGVATISGPDMTFVQTFRTGRIEPEPYLPGSSLKGVMRSHAERIVNTIGDKTACMPFKKHNEDYGFCGNKFQEKEKQEKNKEKNYKISNEDVYKNSCPICKLFGSTYFVGRISISDAYALQTPQKEIRDGVGIDRYTGGASQGAKFDLQPVVKGDFQCSVYVRNFEIWQLGLLGCLLKDLKDSYIYIGSGKSRGLGKVTASWQNFSINVLGGEDYPDKIPGVGFLLGQGGTEYGYKSDDFISLTDSLQWTREGIRNKLQPNNKELDKIMDPATNKFFTYIQDFK